MRFTWLRKVPKAWKSAEARFSKEKGGVFLILDFAPTSLKSRDVIAAFGEPNEPLQPHVIPDGPHTDELLMGYKNERETVTWLFTKSELVKRLIVDFKR